MAQRFACVALAALCVMAASPQPTAPSPAVHPRIWLTSSLLTVIRAKASAGDRTWVTLKASADRLLDERTPRFTITSASNANPVEFTMSERVPWTGSVSLFIGGGTGPWATLTELAADRPQSLVATRTSDHRFTVSVDSRAFGPFDGQHLVLFFSEGGFSNYGYQGFDWLSAVQALGMAYQVTGKPAYAQKGIELLEYIASLGNAGITAPVAIDSGFPSRSTIVALALGYDWFHDRLTGQQKRSLVAALNAWYDWFKRSAFQNDGPAYGNYFGGHVMGFGLAGYATESDNPRAHEITAHVRGLFDSHVPPAFASGGFAGGYPIEGYVYGANHFQRLLYYMLAVKTATGEDLFASTDYAQKMARNLLYNLKPNRWQVTDEAAYPGDYTAVLQPLYPVVLAHMLAGTREGGWMQFLSQNLGRAPSGDEVDDPFSQLLFDDKHRAAIDYRATEPTWHYSPGDGHLYRRSSWRDNAVWTSISAGAANWSGHQMRAAGHVSIQRGADNLLVNSGQWKGADGISGTPAAFDVRSWRGNTLFVQDLGEYLFRGENYVGGQGFWGSNAVLGVTGDSTFAYLKADLTSAYTVGEHAPLDSRSVRSFERSFVSMGDGVMVLLDRIALRKPGYTSKLFFHFNPAGGLPSIAGRTVMSKVGSSVIHLNTLWPEAARLERVPDPVSDDDPRPVTYRVEISEPGSPAVFNALNVFVAAAANTSGQPVIERIQSSQGHTIGAAVTEGSTKRVALFALDGKAQSAVTYRLDAQGGEGTAHIVADLMPNTSYDVLLNGTALNPVAVSAQGVASFVAAGGGLFEIRRGVTRP